ncbi:MAG: metallophosphoesterase [Pseudonocardiaceae bacterium]|nr:metallophosphoesterase [Pseudonocardiaceae bacterium]
MVVATTNAPGRSSRDSESGAGWLDCSGPGVWCDDVPDGTRSLSWLRPSVLWQSRNDVVATTLADPTPAARARWVELARQRAGEGTAVADFVIAGPAGDSVSMLLVGDPGEGDNAQYAVAHELAEQSKSADFAVICSDVIYPAGDQADYGRKFHHPYRNVGVPIYALPGNHDWYEGLHAFMHYFCKLDDPGYVPRFGRGPAAWLASRLWRKPQQDSGTAGGADGVTVAERPPPDPVQPAPYFAIDAGPARYVGIDTGINGEVDAAQYEWLQRVSLQCPERPKILLTGKPIYVDGTYRPGRVIGSRQTVDQVVTDPRANFVMAIGGDIHNYQRYPVKLADERTIQYVVSGGGGAYMHATHVIPPVYINGVTESDFRCYPLRRDSLARFSQIVDRRLFGGLLRTSIEPQSAARYYADRGIVSRVDRELADRLSLGVRLKAALVRRIPAGRLFHRFGSEAFAFDSPPFFKNFLRVDLERTSATVTCFGVTGCAGTEHTPSVEDRFTITW